MKIIFAGGGTAGHVNPALAIADYMKKKDPGCAIAFAGGTGGIEERLVGRAGYPIYTFPLEGLSRSLSFAGIKRNVKALWHTQAAIAKCKKIIGEQKPDIVVGTGGYACYPMVAAAQKCGVKTATLEVNATPGVALKGLSGNADCVMVSFEETKKFFPKAKKLVYTGSPVRQELIDGIGKPHTPVFHNDKPTVLCFWGSVGALYMNKKMEEFIQLLDEDKSFNLLLATGKANYEWLPGEVEKLGVRLEGNENIRVAEYIYDMADRMNGSDLVICRAGASTLAEICACGKPSLIVPSPYVADNHQEKNARALERAGAAVVALEKEIEGKDLFEQVKKMLSDPAALREMGQKARAMAKYDALDRIYAAIVDTVG